MTIPYERTRSILETRDFLRELQDPRLTPRVPAGVREVARKLLRHYPAFAEVEFAHKALPHLFGPVPPFSRAHAQTAITALTLDKIGQIRCEVCVYEQHETPDGRIVMSQTCARCGASNSGGEG